MLHCSRSFRLSCPVQRRSRSAEDQFRGFTDEEAVTSKEKAENLRKAVIVKVRNCNRAAMAELGAERGAIFEGRDYRGWKAMMEWQFRANNHFSVVTDATVVSVFKNLTPEQQEGDEGQDFRTANISACFSIMKSVSGPIRSKLSKFTLAFDMWAYLSNTYDPKLLSIKNETRVRLNSLRFVMHGNMEGFIKKFHNLLDNYRYQGGNVSDEEEIEMFKATLPIFFGPIKDWFDNLSYENQNILNLQNKCLNRHNEYSLERNKKKHDNSYGNSKNSSHNSRGGDSHTGNGMRADHHHQHSSSSDSQKVVKCHNCGGIGHYASQCPSKKAKKEHFGSGKGGYQPKSYNYDSNDSGSNGYNNVSNNNSNGSSKKNYANTSRKPNQGNRKDGSSASAVLPANQAVFPVVPSQPPPQFSSFPGSAIGPAFPGPSSSTAAPGWSGYRPQGATGIPPYQSVMRMAPSSVQTNTGGSAYVCRAGS